MNGFAMAHLPSALALEASRCCARDAGARVVIGACLRAISPPFHAPHRAALDRAVLDIEGARATAAELTAEAAAGKLRGPLHGVPVGIKDEFHVEGMPTYFADPEGKPQPVDATPVALPPTDGEKNGTGEDRFTSARLFVVNHSA